MRNIGGCLQNAEQREKCASKKSNPKKQIVYIDSRENIEAENKDQVNFEYPFAEDIEFEKVFIETQANDSVLKLYRETWGK